MTRSDQRRQIELPVGTVRYREAGEGKPVVFVHGYLVDGRLWDGVVDSLADRCRCLAPDWPLGAQRVAMNPDADLSPPGIAALIAGFLEALDLSDATIVGNDSGGAMSQVLVTRHPERIGRLVLTNCDTHENFPPGIFKAMPPIAALPGGMSVLAAPFRIGAFARAAFRPFSRNPIPAELIASWMEPGMKDPGVRHDLKKVTAGMNKRYTLEAAEKLRDSELPILLAWAPGDRFFPIKYAKRLAEATPNAHLVEIPDSNTFVPLDQPQRLAEEIAAFAGAGGSGQNRV
ncbi:MAG TPA: alpha/beta hydrolase [Solirubrobacterales bacterium]|jgi:pimeloyl-ACP methyl ester carboxylesterase|nr:alpha/beta hydrolase [Solirubrobacterales bacterium]